MKLSQSALYSIILSLIMMAGLAVFFGVTMLAIVLLLPVGFLVSNQRRNPSTKQSGPYRTADPIKPK
jgi:ABC-type transport system involved in cytochrome bd biosynthesis fused ATPase/permease subunit